MAHIWRSVVGVSLDTLAVWFQSECLINFPQVLANVEMNFSGTNGNAELKENILSKPLII